MKSTLIDKAYKNQLKAITKIGLLKQSKIAKDQFIASLSQHRNLQALVLLKEGYVEPALVKIDTLSFIIRHGAKHWGDLAKYLIDNQIGFQLADIYPKTENQIMTLMDQLMVRVQGAVVLDNRLDKNYEATAMEVAKHLLTKYPDANVKTRPGIRKFEVFRRNLYAENIASQEASQITARPRIKVM